MVQLTCTFTYSRQFLKGREGGNKRIKGAVQKCTSFSPCDFSTSPRGVVHCHVQSWSLPCFYFVTG